MVKEVSLASSLFSFFRGEVAVGGEGGGACWLSSVHSVIGCLMARRL